MLAEDRKTDLPCEQKGRQRRGEEEEEEEKKKKMSASSPVASNNSNDTASNSGTMPPRRSALLDTPKQSLRGLNKPKCFQCGNVARSRCPFHSCKSCCAKAQNPCHIHVLKQNATLPDKPAPSNSPMFDKPSTDASPSGYSLRLPSLRQLSNKFAQFNGAQVTPRARRQLSRKDAAAINAWRFLKLKEYNDRNVEAENEAFDRYMQNVSLLEEAFFVDTTLDGLAPDGFPVQDSVTLTSEDELQKLILGMKAKLKSNVESADKCRQGIRDLIAKGLMWLKKWEFDDTGASLNTHDISGERELKRPRKGAKWRAEKHAALSDLLDKLSQARSEEELRSCLQMKMELFNQNEVADSLASEITDFHPSDDAQIFEEQNREDMSLPRKDFNVEMSFSSCSLPKLYRAAQVNQTILSSIDMQFCSPDQIANL